ncbi:hypothetical protein [Amycolatopsis sacchari]|uniref:Uncharacterized protein n=1 Tax=Amycolatopsis sacchari TaxID=115433 RepID=A0A1I3M050_9PSEU|nr:hypothetical protein [Amycolatopsis sacchari]SFI90358.1 hypothetical protein SAMN05421835_102122 [Amycolatopsis sacchari]
MTYPPQPGQPGPYDPRQQYPGGQQYPPQQQWGQQPQYPQQPGWGAPQPGGYPGGPGGEPPRRGNKGLIAAIIVGVVLLVGGGVTAIVLLTGGGDDKQQAAPQPPPPAPASSSGKRTASSSPSSSATGKATPEELQDAILDAYNTRVVSKFPPLSCVPMTAAETQELQSILDKVPAQVVYSAAAAPQVTGSTGTLTLQASAAGNSRSFPMPIRKSGSGWCMSG